MNEKKETSVMTIDYLIDPRKYFIEIVDSGLNHRSLKTYPQVKEYLANLLHYYLDARNLYEVEVDEFGNKSSQTLAEAYLKANLYEPAAKREALKKLADKALYVSGFFGDSLDRKLVDVDYYANIGVAAYSSLSECTQEDTTAQVFQVFSRRFIDFVDVLTYISQKSFVNSNESILRLYDKYLRTGSSLALERLTEMGVVTVPQAQGVHQKKC